MEDHLNENLQNRFQDELSDIPLFLQEHLLDMYFGNFQIILKIVPEQAFREQRRIGCGPAYSKSLCLALLGTGARFSPMKDSLKPFQLPEGNNVFMKRSKALLESEVRHATICTVQTLLILADLEAYRGRDLTGSMLSGKTLMEKPAFAYQRSRSLMSLFTGMGTKLLFEMQLNLGSSPPGLSESETETRHSLLWFAAVQDK